MLEILVSVFTLVCSWQIFRKMGRKGWEAIVPFYNFYVLFEMLYGNGWKFLLLLIPLYNIYLFFRIYIDLAKEFHYGAGFGVGLALIYPIFGCILAFGNCQFRNGVNKQDAGDPISETIDSAANFVSDAFSGKTRRDPEALNKLEQLKTMKDNGVISEEEYEKMKADLMSRV